MRLLWFSIRLVETVCSVGGAVNPTTRGENICSPVLIDNNDGQQYLLFSLPSENVFTIVIFDNTFPKNRQSAFFDGSNMVLLYTKFVSRVNTSPQPRELLRHGSELTICRQKADDVRSLLHKRRVSYTTRVVSHIQNVPTRTFFQLQFIISLSHYKFMVNAHNNNNNHIITYFTDPA